MSSRFVSLGTIVCALAAGVSLGLISPGAFASSSEDARIAALLEASNAGSPTVGECLDLPLSARWDDAFAVGETVQCETSHNSEVFFLGTYPEDWGAPSSERKKISDFSFTFQACPNPFQTLDTYLQVGGAATPSIPTRFFPKAAPPTDEEWQAGSRAVRCIVHALSGPIGKEAPTSWNNTLPEKVKASGWKEFAKCTQKGKPKSGVDNPGFRCKSNNQWVGLARVFELKGKAGKPFPGAQVQKAANRACLSAVQGLTKGKKVVPFAAVESKQIWDEGFREAVCYVPLSQWNGKPAK